MKASRIMTGFRHLRLVLVIPCAAACVINLGIGIYALATMPPPGRVVRGPDFKWHFYREETSNEEIAADLNRIYGRPFEVGMSKDIGVWSTQMSSRNEMRYAFLWAGSAAAIGALAYFIVWAVGWVVCRFASEP